MISSIVVQAAGIAFVGTVVLSAAALLADRFLPPRFVRERHDFAVAVFLVVPLLFVVALTPAPQGAASIPTYIAGGADVAAIAAPNGFDPETAAPIAPPSTSDTALTRLIPTGLLGVWFLGTIAMLARLIVGLSRLSILTARAEPAPDAPGLSRRVDIRRSGAVSAPILVGYVRPVILVPADFRLDADAVPVLEHEIAHVTRRDNVIALALRVITALFFWNVVLYALWPMVCGAREKLCDSRAVAITGAPQDLARALLDTAARALRPPSSLAAAAHRSALAARVRRLSAPGAARRRRSMIALPVIAPVLAMAAIVATPHVSIAHPHEDDRDGYDWYADGDDPLYRAARRGRLDDVNRLIAAGWDVDAVSRGDGTPLIAAVRGRNRDILNVLLDHGADPDAPSPGDGTPLIVAARHGRADFVTALLEAGANPDVGSSGDGAPLIAAARHGHASSVDILLAAGADPDGAVSGDGNALIGAALAGRTDIAQVLIDAGADPNSYVPGDETPLVNAAQVGSIAVAEVLVAAGADVSLTVAARRFEGDEPIYRSPLSEARRRGHGDMEQWLLARGAEHRPPADD